MNALTPEPEPVQPSAAPEVHAQLRGVTRSYPGVQGGKPLHALGPIDLDLFRGEFFSVVGPSGCGKSTLLDVLGGLAVPSQGMVAFEGQVVAGRVPDGVGIVFQEDTSFPWLTIYDNAAFSLRRSGMHEAEIRERVEHALSFMGLRGFANAYPAQLSGGMRQRLCIARTLVTRPRLLLLDEPFGALDQQTRLLMGDELLKLWRETDATVLLITHALDEAAMLSDRVGVMSARPGVFLDVVTTGWARERSSAIVADESFGRITARLWSTLREQSLKAMAQGQTDAVS